MKYIFVLLFLLTSVFGSVLKSKVASIDLDEGTLTIKIDKVNIGMSGFVVHQFAPHHSSILKNVVVKSFDKERGEAILQMSKYNDLVHSALPKGLWEVHVGDEVVLAYGYSRAVLIAPTEEIYYRIVKSAKSLQWVHADVFTTLLSVRGHPTPLKEDFIAMSKATSVGLFFFFLEKKLYTVDARSFKILNISDAPLEQDPQVLKLPFYSRIDEIDANWFGDGSDELQDYELYYYELLTTYNYTNQQLYNNMQNSTIGLENLLEQFELEEEI